MSWELEQIGPCTLYRGDALEILPTLANIGQVVTSPPFNAGRSYERTTWATLEDFYRFTHQWVSCAAQCLRAGGWMCVEVQDMHLSPEHPHALAAQTEQSSMATHCFIGTWMIEAGLLFKASAVWPRGRWVGNASRLICAPGSPAILTQHSNVLFGRRPGGMRGAYAFPELSPRDKARWCRSVWDHIQPEAVEGHPSPMPLAMALGMIAGWSLPPDTICDPFLGSGTTGVAAIMLQRAFVGIEVLREYFDRACQRIEAAYAQGDLFHVPCQTRLRQEVLL